MSNFITMHTQNVLYYSPLLAFAVVSGPFGIHTCNRTAPDFTSTEPRPSFSGGPELNFLVHIRVQLHLPK